MISFELDLEAPDPARARQSALIIALSYIADGLIPLAPCILLYCLSTALWVSVALMLTGCWMQLASP